MERKPVLGKGLASLFPGMNAPATPPAAPVTATAPVTPPAPAETAAPTPEAAKSDQPAAGATSVPNVPILPVPPAAPTAAPASSAAPSSPTVAERQMGISLENVADIKENPYQPRREFDEKALEELAASIRSSGIIQPLVIRKGPNGELQLIAGERRLRAAKLAGLKQVPVVVRRSTTDREALELALIENIQRQNLGCIDEALAYQQLAQDFSLTQEEISTRVGKERATVANHLRLLRLPQEIIEDLRAEKLSFGHGKVLLGLEDAASRMKARGKIIERKLSVRDAEALVEAMRKGAESALNDTGPNLPSHDPAVKRKSTLELELTRKWNARVELKGTEKRGKIVFHYTTRQELDRLVEALHN